MYLCGMSLGLDLLDLWPSGIAVWVRVRRDRGDARLHVLEERVVGMMISI